MARLQAACKRSPRRPPSPSLGVEFVARRGRRDASASLSHITFLVVGAPDDALECSASMLMQWVIGIGDRAGVMCGRGVDRSHALCLSLPLTNTPHAIHYSRTVFKAK